MHIHGFRCPRTHSDLCGQLRHEKETLEQRLQEEESTRARLEHACAAAESAADKIRSEIVRQDKERVATRASESSTDSAEKMVESLREQLRSASDDTARTIAVCAAAVEGEKARAAEVLVLQTRVTELELAQQQHVTLQTAGLGAGGGIGDEDSVLSRYNVLLRHAQGVCPVERARSMLCTTISVDCECPCCVYCRMQFRSRGQCSPGGIDGSAYGSIDMVHEHACTRLFYTGISDCWMRVRVRVRA